MDDNPNWIHEFNNHWTICRSYDFQGHQQCSQWVCFSQTALLWFEVLPDWSPALPGLALALPGLSPVLPGAHDVLSGAPTCSQTYHNHSHGTPVPVIRDPSYSECRPECPPRVWDSPDIDASKCTLHILSDTPGGFQRLQYVLLMWFLALGHSSSSLDKSYGQKDILPDPECIVE
jgi:hypothetical protein